MRRPIVWMMVALFLGFTSFGSLYAAEQSSSHDSKAREAIGDTSQTGDFKAQKDAEVFRGKLLKVDAETYTVETSPGRSLFEAGERRSLTAATWARKGIGSKRL